MKKENQISENKEPIQEKNIQKHKSEIKVYFRVCFLTLGSFYVGYALGMLNLAQPKLNLVYDINENKPFYEGLLGSAVNFGAVFGCFITGYFLKKYSERNLSIACDILGILFSLLYIFPYYYVALTGRFLMGVLVGANTTIVPYYVRQISPVSIVGKTVIRIDIYNIPRAIIGIIIAFNNFQGSFHQVQFSLGIFVAYSLGLGFPLEDDDLEKQGDFYWRFVLLFPILTCLIRLLSLKYIYKLETCQYYIQIQQVEQAQIVIENEYNKEFQSEQLQIFIDEINKEKSRLDVWKVVFSKLELPKLKVGITLAFVLQFSGVSAVTLYSSSIFKEATGSDKIANIMTVISGALLVIVAFFSGELGKYYGRRPILLVGNAFLMIILALIGIIAVFQNENNISNTGAGFTIALMFLYLIVFNLSDGTFKWIYNADILVGKSLSLENSINWFFGFVIGIIFPILQHEIGMFVMFFIFSFSLLIGNIYLYNHLKETKGLTRDQINHIYSDFKSHSNNLDPNLEKNYQEQEQYQQGAIKDKSPSAEQIQGSKNIIAQQRDSDGVSEEYQGGRPWGLSFFPPIKEFPETKYNFNQKSYVQNL